MAAPKKAPVSSRRTGSLKAAAPKKKEARSPAVVSKTSKKTANKPKFAPKVKAFDEHHCASCSSDLRKGERALFVEEEVGRVFCTEECISTYFASDIDALERDWQSHRQRAKDLTDEERDSFAHLRWVTLEQPDEIWRERTAAGDWRYTLISEFQPGDRRVWCVVTCLFLRGEPSFLFLAVPTQDQALVAHYRKGERISRTKVVPKAGHAEGESESFDSTADAGEETAAGSELVSTDGLADSWTHEETIRAQMRRLRSKNDIPESRFEEFEASVGQTLEAPDEVWSSALASSQVAEEDDLGAGDEEMEQEGAVSAPRLYHFIKAYSEEAPPYWYVVIARDTQEEGQIEVLDSFPTNDAQLVESLRVGTHEFGENEPAAYSRLVH
jgi:hypothetical protein